MLKNALALGAAVPVVGVWPGTRAPSVRPQLLAAASAASSSAWSSAQLAGQRVVYSYAGLTVSLANLRARDEVPYPAAIAAGSS